MHCKYSCLVTAIAAMFSFGAHAASGTANAVPAATPSTSNGHEGVQLVREYTPLAGSTANAQSLVTGLRSGTPITLQSASTGVANSTTFSTQTQSMGWGNVSKALSLAQADLASMGITNPSPQQLQAVLIGGTVTAPGSAEQVNGILTMRSQGIGWGQIAHQLNLPPGNTFQLGHMENRTQATIASHGQHHDAANHASRAATPLSHPPINRVITAAGTPLSAGAAFNHAKHGSDPAELNQSSRMTTAAGVGAGGVTTGDHDGGHGNATGHGKD